MNFERAQAQAQRPLASAPYHQWLSAEGAVWAQFHRAGDGYLVRFPGLADFEISGPELAVVCHPAPEVTADTCEHLFLNQITPLVLSRQGRLVFHASAVEIEGGAVAFLGGAGRGKSTLAASFATNGHGFLTDDGLVVEERGGEFWVLPSHPSIRLWDDSREALVGPEMLAAPPVQYTTKARLLAGKGMAFCREARPLRGAFVLGEGTASTVIIERMRGGDSLMPWVRNAFLLEPGEAGQLASHFERATALAERVGCYRLDYPRHYDDLPFVRKAIMQCIHGEEVAR